MKNPNVILGTVQLGTSYGISNKHGKPSERTAFEILDAARVLNVTTLDTAPSYGDALDIVGRYHDASSFRFSILSKFKLGSLKNNLSCEIKNQLERLKVPSLQTFSFHSFAEYANADTSVRSGLQKLVSDGLVQDIGVSAYTVSECLTAISDPLISTLQFPYNILDNYNVRKRILEDGLRMNKKLHSRSVFLQGIIFMTKADIITRIPKLTEVADAVEEIQSLAESENVSISDLAIRYVAATGGIESIVLGVDSPQQLHEIFKSLSGTISLDLIEKINKISVKHTSLLLPSNW